MIQEPISQTKIQVIKKVTKHHSVCYSLKHNTGHTDTYFHNLRNWLGELFTPRSEHLHTENILSSFKDRNPFILTTKKKKEKENHVLICTLLQIFKILIDWRSLSWWLKSQGKFFLRWIFSFKIKTVHQEEISWKWVANTSERQNI